MASPTTPSITLMDNVISFSGSEGGSYKVYKYDENNASFALVESLTAHADERGISSHIQRHSGGSGA